MIKTTKSVLEILTVLFGKKDPNLSEIARHIGLSVMGVSKIVKQLEKNNIVHTTKIGRSLVVRINKSRDNLELFSLAEKYKFQKFVEKHKKLSGFLVELKERTKDKIDFLLIFGSYAAGEESPRSDLDLLVVSSHKDIAKTIKELAVLVDVSIAPITIKIKDFIEQYNKNHRLYKEIVDGKRILICGEYAFWKTILTLK